MIQFDQITVRRGSRILFQNASFTLPNQAKVGLIGQNGSGKSSLFSVIAHQLSIDHGDYRYPKQMRIAHIEQETPALQRSALDYVLDGDQVLRTLEQKLKQAEAEHDALAIAETHQRLEEIDAYSAIARASRLLTGLGFSHAECAQMVSSFSGGWRMRLNLAQALMKPSDLLLLDEPTNHLDLNTIVWLERYLQHYAGMLIVISHDRDFLDKVIDCTLHINHQGIDYYQGNYSSFERQRAEKIALQQASNKKIAAKQQHLQAFIDRFKAKASKARQAQSRVKALEKLATIQVAQTSSPFSFQFGAVPSCGAPMMTTEGLQLGYSADQAQLQQVNLTLLPQDRIGLIGANGQGKSTLLKAICGDLQPQQGVLTLNPKTKIGYFAQHQIDALDETQALFDQVMQVSTAKQAHEQTIRNFLGRFNFHGERIFEPLQQFSGGEKARFALAKIIWQLPNLLILDEPTNHLDIDMCDALNLALQSFEGALILVSHNRSLLNSCTNQLWVAKDHTITPFEGSLDEYISQVSKLAQQQQTASVADKPNLSSDSTKSGKNKKQLRQEAAAVRTKRQPLVKKLQQCEKAFEQQQQALAQLEQKLSDAALYQAQNKLKLKDYLAEQVVLKQQLEQAEEGLLAAMEALEQFDASAE